MSDLTLPFSILFYSILFYTILPYPALSSLIQPYSAFFSLFSLIQRYPALFSLIQPYLTIFETGVGTFSSVFCARRRLDGILYAVKRIKKKIGSESEGRLVIKESCAHAALGSCPSLIQYFGCWMDDGHLHIQTEYCDRGSMDCFVIPARNRDRDRDRDREKFSIKNDTRDSLNCSQSSTNSDSNSLMTLPEIQDGQGRVQSMSCKSNAVDSESAQRARINPGGAQKLSSPKGTQRECCMDNYDDLSETLDPTVPRPFNRFSEAMQGVGEDSQNSNSNSNSCFSDNHSLNGMTGNASNIHSDSPCGDVNNAHMQGLKKKEDKEEDKEDNGHCPLTSVEEQRAPQPADSKGKMTEVLAWIVLRSIGAALAFMHKKGKKTE